MNATLMRTAKAAIYKMPKMPPDRPAFAAMIRIDGIDWFSALPTNSGEAVSINQDAERIVEAVKRV